jgi:hypothetical protein
MNGFGSVVKPLMWCMSLLLSALVAGCGGADGTGSAAGGVCAGGTGAAAPCVDLLTAGDFVILSTTGITDVPTSPITGNVGSSAITGAAILVTCAEVRGTIYAVDAAGPAPCSVADGPKLTAAVNDMGTAFTDAAGRPTGPLGPDPTPGTLNTVDGAAAVPGVYTWTTAVDIASDFTLTGGPTDVWIFQIGGTLTQAANTTVTLAGGAMAKNIFWQVPANVSIGAGAHFEGVILAQDDIALVTGASVNGRLYAGTAVALDQNTIVRPAP